MGGVVLGGGDDIYLVVSDISLFMFFFLLGSCR